MADGDSPIQFVRDDRRWAVVPRVHSALDGAYETGLTLSAATDTLGRAQERVPELEWVLVTHEEATREKPVPGQDTGRIAADGDGDSRTRS